MNEDKKQDDLPCKTKVNWHDFECKTLGELAKHIQELENANMDIINIKVSIFHRVN